MSENDVKLLCSFKSFRLQPLRPKIFHRTYYAHATHDGRAIATRTSHFRVGWAEMDMEALTFSSPTTRRLRTAYFQSGVGVAHANQLQYLLRFLSHFPCLFHSIFLRNLPEHFCIFNYLTNTKTTKFYVYARRPTVCATTAQEDDLTLESLSTLLPQYSTHKRTCGTGFSKSKIDTIIRE